MQRAIQNFRNFKRFSQNESIKLIMKSRTFVHLFLEKIEKHKISAFSFSHLKHMLKHMSSFQSNTGDDKKIIIISDWSIHLLSPSIECN